MNTEIKELLEWYKDRVGLDGIYLIAALNKAIEYLEMLWTVVPREKIKECLNDIETILNRGRGGLTDEDARKAGWRDQVQRQEFLDQMQALSASMRHLAAVIKNH